MARSSEWDKFANRCFDAIESLRLFQEKWPRAWRAAKGIPTIGGVPGYTYFKSFENFASFTAALQHQPIAVALNGLLSGAIGGLLYAIGSILLGPVLTLYPIAVASRELGFRRGATHEDASLLITARYARQCRGESRVRVICLSGRYLFSEPSSPGPGGYPTPLRDLALKGQLDVVMPRSARDNPTIRHRVNTYTHPLNEELATADHLVAEIERGKQFLRQNLRNKVHEHDMLCMWRVVLFDDVCVVQNYFPNSLGGESFKAPVFVFERLRDGKTDGFYSAFSKMFEMLRDGGGTVPLTSPTPSTTLASMGGTALDTTV